MRKLQKIKMFVTDFDGTLAGDNAIVSVANIEALKKLQNHEIITVIATGRSLFSLAQVIDKIFPVDYVVFSTGVGVMHHGLNEIYYSYSFNNQEVNEIYSYLKNEHYNFMIHLPVPDNHIFYANYSTNQHFDFLRRIAHYDKLQVKIHNQIPQKAAQFVVICDNDQNHYEKIFDRFPNYKVIKTTSPFDGQSLWVEIFPKPVSKANGIKYLCNLLQIKNEETIVVGNDYNDIDMLDWADNAYVTGNAPSSLLQAYKNLDLNTNDAIAKLIDIL